MTGQQPRWDNQTIRVRFVKVGDTYDWVLGLGQQEDLVGWNRIMRWLDAEGYDVLAVIPEEHTSVFGRNAGVASSPETQYVSRYRFFLRRPAR